MSGERNKTCGVFAGGVADHRSPGRHILGHHRPRPHDGRFTDGHAGKNDHRATDCRAAFHRGSLQLPVAFLLDAPVFGGRGRVAVVQEVHVVPDEYLVFDCHALANERVTLNLASGSHLHASLDLDESAD